MPRATDTLPAGHGYRRHREAAATVRKSAALDVVVFTIETRRGEAFRSTEIDLIDRST